MKNKDFAVFIITHGRVNEQKTLQALLDCNYTGKIYLVIDNLDSQMLDYIEKYKDMVIVFDKEKIYQETDTMDNFHSVANAVYARNFIQKYVNPRGFKILRCF